MRQGAQEDDGDEQARNDDERPTGKPEPEHERSDDYRRERITQVAADVEQRHPTRTACCARIRGELRSFRVVCGDAESGHDGDDDDEPIGMSDRYERGRSPRARVRQGAATARRGGRTRARTAVGRGTTTVTASISAPAAA